jgi:glycosyltransferase involved in cell wall biosynthesis
MFKKKKLVFISAGDFDSPMGIRARSFSLHLGHNWNVSILYKEMGKFRSLINNIFSLIQLKPEKVVILDCHFSGVIAGIFYTLISGKSYILDTGDVIFELGKAIGRSKIEQFFTFLLEKIGTQLAVRVIVRGRSHLRFLGRKSLSAVWIPDGVDVHQFKNFACDRYPVSSRLVIGLVGSLIWNKKTSYCYGLDLIDVVDGLVRQQNIPVEGIIIGDGSGLEYLKKKVSDLGLNKQIQFFGRVKYDKLPSLISRFSVALSNQSNDIIGEVRTTGKLPLYLSSGCFVISTNVGEASRILPQEMLVNVSGSSNAEFSNKCIQLILDKLKNGESFDFKEGPEIAEKLFEYSKLSLRYEKAIITKHRVTI